MTGRHDAVAEPAADRVEQRIRESVVALLEADGAESLQVREVARRARVSLTTIYKLYGTRDELILAALDRWMAENSYAPLADHTLHPGDTLHMALMRVLRPIFEPWESHPRLLAAYFRVITSTRGQTLMNRGLEAVFPAAMAALEHVDLAFIEDLEAILRSLIYGLMGRFASGAIEATDIVPAVDRAVFWLCTGYEAGKP